MRRSTLDVELVTPGFLGGAEPKKTCEWRAASVRGQLRWWFRAVAGGRYRGDLAAVRAAERDVFGDTRQASRVRVQALGAPAKLGLGPQSWGERVADWQLAERWELDRNDPDWLSGRLKSRWAVNPLLYLGYGCVEFHKDGKSSLKLARPCLAPCARALLRFQWQARVGGAELDGGVGELWRQAVWAWLHLGGIGSRSRRGFGSLAVRAAQGFPGDWVKLDRSGFANGARELLPAVGRSDAGEAPPRWSHFSSSSAIYLGCGDGYRSWDDALVRAGGWLMAFRRRYGFPNEARQGLAHRDYHWAKEAGRRASPSAVPDRAGFGLPLPFGKRPEQIVSWGAKDEDNRRASPLLIHVARFGERFFPVFTHLPAKLLPDGEKLRFKGLDRPTQAPGREQRSIVGRFLADLETKKLVERIAP